MYSMKETCERTGLKYETLKFYCNKGLVPNVKRDNCNYRVFDDADIAWINNLNSLKKCSMSLAEMKVYLNLTKKGESSIPERKAMLEKKSQDLLAEIETINESLKYIERRQRFYNSVLAGKTKYVSNM